MLKFIVVGISKSCNKHEEVIVIVVSTYESILIHVIIIENVWKINLVWG